MRLARQAVEQWKKAVRRAREEHERDRRTLQALADVHIGISSSPFKVQWPANEPQNKVATFSQCQPLCHAPFSARQPGVETADKFVMVYSPSNFALGSDDVKPINLLCVTKPATHIQPVS